MLMKEILKDLTQGVLLTADSETGMWELTVPDGVVLSKPLFLTDVLGSDDELEVSHDMRITLASGSCADVVIADRCAAERNFRIQRNLSVEVAADATLNLCLEEETGVSATCTCKVNAACTGTLTAGFFCLGGGEVNYDVHLDLAGQGAVADVYGMAVAAGSTKVRNHVEVSHSCPHCTDRELFKYILDGEATARFEGVVRVLPGAVGADSQQLSRAICLSRAAHMYAQPQLIIDHDDVRCSHGATVGQLDEQALFYMQQRGIPRHEARLLLLASFLAEVIDKVPVPSQRDRIMLLSERLLRGDFNHCVSCGICQHT